MTQRLYDQTATIQLWKLMRGGQNDLHYPADIPHIIDALDRGGDPRAVPNRRSIRPGRSYEHTSPLPYDILFYLMLHSGQGEQGSPLYQAIALALEKGSDVNARRIWPTHLLTKDKTSLKDTPLHEAAKRGKTDIVKLLLEKGAEVNAQDSGGDTPLHIPDHLSRYSLIKGHVSSILAMIRAGADMSIPNEDGKYAPQVWSNLVLECLGSRRLTKEWGREQLVIYSHIEHGGDALPYIWQTFDAPAVARDATLPRDSVLTEYVRGVATDKTRAV